MNPLLSQTAVTGPGKDVMSRLAANQAILRSGQTLNAPEAAQASTDYASANQGLANIDNPETRQAHLDANGIPQSQANYDALAKQLASYDQMVLQPQFAGSNPGPASDVASRISGYYNPNLSYNSTDAQTPEQTLYNANPKYGLATQAAQSSSIVDLLTTLNDAIAKEYKKGTAEYGTRVGNITRLLPQLNDILTQNTNLTISKNQLEATKNNRDYDRAQTARMRVENFATKIQSDLSSHEKGWGEAWHSVDDYSKANGANLTPAEIDNLLGGKYDSSDPTGEKGLTTGWAKPGAWEDRAISQNQLKVRTSPDMVNQIQQLQGSGSLVNQLEQAYNKVGLKGPLVGIASMIGGATGISSEAQHFDDIKKGLSALIARASGEKGVLTDQDVARAQHLMGDLTKNPETVVKDYNSLRQIFNEAISRKTGLPIQLVGSDGTVYQYPSPEDSDYKKRVSQEGVLAWPK